MVLPSKVAEIVPSSAVAMEELPLRRGVRDNVEGLVVEGDDIAVHVAMKPIITACAKREYQAACCVGGLN